MITGSDIQRFRELLARLLGWTFADDDAGQLGRLLSERAAQHRITRTDYLNRLAARPWTAEITDLIEQLSITETYFFRHGEQFRALREEALPERVAARAAQRVLRMLSVACSSGEEAYSLAITGRQVRPDPDWIISVRGLDANPAVLRRAEAARYSTWSLRETPDAVRRRWFAPNDGGYQVAEEARRLVQFQQYNVASDDDDDLWRPGQYDVIFCRNLLMYLTADVAATLVARMTEALAPGGFLFLGHTDSLGSSPAGLELRHNGNTFYYRRLGGPVSAPAEAGVPDRPEGATDRPGSATGAAGTATGPEVTRQPPRESGEDVHNRAVGLLREERFADALALITADGTSRPAPGDGLLHGVLLAQTGRLGEAVDEARRLIDEDGLSADAHQLLGLCLEESTAVDEAIAQYRLAAYLDPGFALPRLRLGQLARRRGDDRTAVGELDRALALLGAEREERITLFGGGFGRISLTVLCRSELDACGAKR